MRFYNPTPVDYMSTFVDNSLPYDMMLKAGLAKDKAIDDKLGEINALEQYLNIEGLPVDTKEIEEYKKNVNSLIDPLRSINYNSLLDPVTQRKIIESTKNIKNIHSAALKAYKDRLTNAENEIKYIDKAYENPTANKFFKTNIEKSYYDPENTEYSAKFDKKTGTYKPINKPKYFDWKDIPKDFMEMGKTIETDLRDIGYSIGSIDDFNKIMQDGTIEERTKEKILGALKSRMQNPEYIKTAAGTRNVLYGEDFDTALQEEANAIYFIEDENGKEQLQINPNTILGSELLSTISARTTKKQKLDRKIFDDYGNRKALDKKINEELINSTASTGEINTNPNNPARLFFDENGNFDATKASKVINASKELIEYGNGTKGIKGFFGEIDDTWLGDLFSAATNGASNILGKIDKAARAILDNPNLKGELKKQAEANFNTAISDVLEVASKTGTIVTKSNGEIDFKATAIAANNVGTNVATSNIPSVESAEELNKILAGSRMTEIISYNGKGMKLDEAANTIAKENNFEGTPEVITQKINYVGKEPKINYVVRDSKNKGNYTTIETKLSNKTISNALMPVANVFNDITKEYVTPSKDQSNEYKSRISEGYNNLKETNLFNSLKSKNDLISYEKLNDGSTVFIINQNINGAKIPVYYMVDEKGELSSYKNSEDFNTTLTDKSLRNLKIGKKIK